jgi:hypothetical protein
VSKETINIVPQVLGQTFHNLAQTLQYLAHRYTLPRGVTKRCRLSWLTNSALVYEPKCGGGGGYGVPANVYIIVRAQINFGDLSLI